MEEQVIEGQEPQIDLRDYWNVVIKRRWTVLFFFVVVVTLVTIYTLRQTKIYEAKASVIIEPYAPQVLGNVREVYNLGAGSYWSNKEYYETQYQVITSRAVAQKVVQTLRLEGNKEFLGIDKLPPEQQQRYLEEPIDYVEKVRSMLEVEPVKDSRTAYIKARHRYPKWAQRLANSAVNAYIEYNRQVRRQVSQDAAGWLASQAAELKTRMEDAEYRLYQYKRDNKILSVSLEDRQNIISQRLQDLNQTLNNIQAERIGLEARRQKILDIKEHRLALDAVDKVISNALIQQLKANYVKLKEEQTELSTKYLPDHPKLKMVENKLKLLRRSIDREIDNVMASLESEYQVKLDAEKRLRQELARVKSEAQDVNKKEIEYNRMKRVADNYAALYQHILKRQKEATLAAHQETNNVYKLDSAVEPLRPVYPRVKLNLLLAVVVGLLGGVGLAFFLEYLDNTIKTQEDVERHLRVPFLGVVPSIKLDPKDVEGDVTQLRDNYLIAHPKSSVAECCRTVRTNILFMSPEKSARRILITSAGPQEGKSTVVINLGITMAQSGSRVLLVDTDMRRPRLHKSFGMVRGQGLTTAILGEAEVEEMVRTTDVAGLDILPCGPIPPNPTELFHTERFAQLLEELDRKYDRLMFDSPPVMMVADPLILSHSMDGVLLVVKGGSTSRDLASRALRQLQDVNARILGVVINDLDLEHREYGYYYYRRYGYYYGEKESDASSTG
ncbi:MAG: capsular biosynthesis protein [Deltaproteobacteria bacterium]|nr:MAG: capsular biosynthesis protein [Deltaproteobacteria bacterium]